MLWRYSYDKFIVDHLILLKSHHLASIAVLLGDSIFQWIFTISESQSLQMSTRPS